jgi:hypothetical protein
MLPAHGEQVQNRSARECGNVSLAPDGIDQRQPEEVFVEHARLFGVPAAVRRMVKPHDVGARWEAGAEDACESQCEALHRGGAGTYVGSPHAAGFRLRFRLRCRPTYLV